MNMVKLHVDSFLVAGIEARTSNAREATADAVIPQMWARLHNQNLLNTIPKRVDSNVVAMYTDYVNGKDGPYTYILGAKVSSAKDIPAGMVARRVAAGTYAVFNARGASLPQAIVDAWNQIWSLEKPDRLHRAYKTDFEVYYGAFEQDPAKAQADVYVGVEK